MSHPLIWSVNQQLLMKLLLWNGVWNLQKKNIITTFKKISVMLGRQDISTYLCFNKCSRVFMYSAQWIVTTTLLNVYSSSSNGRKDEEKPNKQTKKLLRNFNNVYNANHNIYNNDNNNSRRHQYIFK